MPRVALVTGVSEGGLGHGLCLSLLDRGYKVYGTVRKLSKAGNLASRGVNLIVMDVNNQEQVKSAVAQIEQEENRLDLLVNNAGHGSMELIAHCDLSKASELFETNVISLIRVTDAFVPLLARSKGTVANVGSIAGYRGMPLMALYSSSKAAVASITDSMRMEFKPLGIKVILVAPGVVKSDFLGNEASATDPNDPNLLYENVDAAFKQCVKSRSGGIAQAKFCSDMARVISQTNPPHVWSAGEGSTMAYYAFGWLPSWLIDYAQTMLSGTSLLKPVRNKAA